MPGKFERRGRGVSRQSSWVMEPAEREWCVRRLQRDQLLPVSGSLTYRQAALVIALLSTVRGHSSCMLTARLHETESHDRLYLLVANILRLIPLLQTLSYVNYFT